MEVISGYEDKNGDIFVTVGMADGNVMGKNGIGYTTELLEKWHKDQSWIGKLQNAHPSQNHPLVYEPKADPELAESAQLDHYTSHANKWGFATFVKTELVTLKNGIKRLLGTFRINEEGAKQAWREKKFPKFNSISTLITEWDEKGFANKAYPIGSSCVKLPAFDEDVAKIHAECTGDAHKCGVTKLGESGVCTYCRYTVLTSFKDIFSSHSKPKVSESSMGNDNADSNPSTEGTDTGTGQTIITDETISSDGKTKLNTQTPEEPVVDWKAKYEELEKATKKKDKAFDEYQTDTNAKLDKLFKEKLEQKIRSRLESIPLFAFDNKEENRESELKRFMKLHPRLTEDEIVENIDSTYKLAPKMKQISERAAKVGESGITNDGKLVAESGMTQDNDILNINEVFG